MSNNYTAQFINLVNDVLLEENVFFNDIKEERKRSYPNIQKKF